MTLLKPPPTSTGATIRAIYLVSRTLGLAPFHYGIDSNSNNNNNQPHARPSQIVRIGSLLATISITIFLLYSLAINIEESYERHMGRDTIQIVTCVEIIFSFARTVLIYWSQLLNHRRFCQVINDGHQLYDHLVTLSRQICTATTNRYEARFVQCTRLIWAKKISLTYQAFYLCVSLWLYPTFLKNIKSTPVYFSSTWLMDGCIVIVSAIYYGGMLVALQFYRRLNHMLTLVVSDVRDVAELSDTTTTLERRRRDAADRLDQLSTMYVSITNYTNSFVRLLSTAIMLTILNALLLILCSVGASVF